MDILGNDENWVISEFETIELGDKRLKDRIIKIAKGRYAHSTASITQSAGSWKDAKGSYRFYDNERVEFEKIILSHQRATKKRIADKAVILAINDTTPLNYSNHPQTEGLGYIDGTDYSYGMFLHPTIAFTSEGMPLGLLHAMLWTRDEIGIKHERKKKPIEQKESYKWIKSYNAVSKINEEFPDIQFISICDREGDIYDLFEKAVSSLQNSKTTHHVLVRAAWNRCVEHPQKYLWNYIESKDIQETITVEVPRKKNKPSRKAEISIRFAQVIIKPPQNRKKENLQFLTLWIVFAHEESPPADTEPISWLLLTTVPIENIDDAIEIIKWYTVRWGIEVFFKVLKSGCNVEKHQLKNDKRLSNCIAIDCIIAWRILFITLMGRYGGTLPASVLFEEFEWKALLVYKHKTTKIPDEEPILGEMVRYVAQLGGFLGRKGDGYPGITVLWRGLIRLNDITITYKIFASS